MSLKKVGQLKKSKPFAKWDILVYCLLAIVVLSLFIGFVFAKESEKINGIVVMQDNQVVFTYQTATDSWEISPTYIDRISVNEEQTQLTVTVETDNHQNVLIIQRKSGVTYMQDANCSYHKDCTKMQAIKDNSGIIICVPHKLKITTTNYETVPSTGA